MNDKIKIIYNIINSWNKIIKNIIGDIASWKVIFIHDIIPKKNIKYFMNKV